MYGAEDRSRRQEQKTGVKNHSLFSSSKTISPVVATALILVVAVVSVVGFQGWFQQYSSSLQGEIEQQGGVASITVQDVIQDRVFIKSSEKTNISSVSLNGNQCSLNDSELQEGLNERKLRCGSAVSAGTAEVVLSTSSGVYSTSHYVESSVFCPEGYVRVPHDDYFTQKDFCVMKWEAKAKNTSSGDIVYDGCGGLDNLTACNSGGTSNWADLSVHEPASTAEGAPWRRISMTNAYTACSNLGSDYHLITNREWMTIARNVENNPKNWDNGAVGNSTLPRGLHSVSGSWTDYNPAPNGSSSCRHADGTSNDINCYGDGDFIDKRSLTLSNGEEVWDLSGNVWDWVDANENGTGVSTGNACSGSDAWYEFTSCTFQNGYAKTGASDTKFEVGPEGAFNANDGMGRIYSDSASNRAFRRGGNWRNGALAGAFALNLGNAPSHSYTRIGFRCSYAP